MATNECTHTDLKLVNFDDRFAFTCNGCSDLGYGSCYTCHPQCNYHLHKDCHMPQPTISHYFFTKGHFSLNQNVPPQNISCEACGMGVEGWRYVLAIEGGGSEISLHPCCMSLPHSHGANGASFVLTEKLESHNLCCAHCHQREGVPGWAYVLATSNVAFHVKCIKDMRHQVWERNYYSPNHQHSNNFQGVHQQRGQNQQRFRKRDLIFGTVNFALGLLGLGGAGEMAVAMVELASEIWGRS